jgi:nicotinic acid mononucleotide adenylyltransferase
VLKYVGNVVVKREHLKRILLDKKAQEYFEQMKEKVIKNEHVNEISQRQVEAEEKREEYLKELKKQSLERINKA